MTSARPTRRAPSSLAHRLGAWCSLLAVCAALLLPGAHAATGCHDDECGGVASAAVQNSGASYSPSPVPHHPSHPQHDDSTCELCRQILISQHGLAPTLTFNATPLGLLAVDDSALAPQRPGSIAPLKVQRSRAPPRA